MSDNNDHIEAHLGEQASNAVVGKDNSQAVGGGASVNIRFAGEDAPERRPKRIWNMDDLYLELTRQLQQTNERMNEMRIMVARLESEVAQLKEVRTAFKLLEQQFEVLRDDLIIHRGDGGATIAKATLAGVILLALIAAYAVYVVSNGI